MEILLNPQQIKKVLKITKIEQYFENTKETKTALFYDLELTHIESGLKASSSGYSEIDAMVDSLNKLNKMVATKEFFDNIPFENVTEEMLENKINIK